MDTEQKIKPIEAGLMIGVALLYDGLSALFNLDPTIVIGWLANFFLNIWSFLTFWLWFKLHGISFVSAKKSGMIFAPFLIENIPWINALPSWTSAVVSLLANNFAEELLQKISPATIQSIGKLLPNKKSGG